MKHTTKSLCTQLFPCHLLVVVSLLGLALLGRPVDSQAGWLTCPPRFTAWPVTAPGHKRDAGLCFSSRMHSLWRYVARSWPQPCLRSLLLMALWVHSGRQAPAVLLGWPWLSALDDTDPVSLLKRDGTPRLAYYVWQSLFARSQ